MTKVSEADADVDGIASLRIRDGIALLLIDAPPVNALGHRVRLALHANLRSAIDNVDVHAIVLACGGRTFFAGADITELGKPLRPPLIKDIIDLLDSAPKPVVAAIHGNALGGGLELALACHYRIATPSARLGLPEVALGLIPAAGGTQRMPRLIGIAAAVEMMAFGRPLTAADALQLGLVDALVDGNDHAQEAATFAANLCARNVPLRRTRDLALDMSPDRASAWLQAFRAAHRRLFHGYLAPDAMLNAVEAAVVLPFDAGIAREAELARPLVTSPESSAQRYLFFAERTASRMPKQSGSETPTIQSILLIGTGAVTSAFAKSLTEAGLKTIMVADRQAAQQWAATSTETQSQTCDVIVCAPESGTASTSIELLQSFDALLPDHVPIALLEESASTDITSLGKHTHHIARLHWSRAGALMEIGRTAKTTDHCVQALQILAKRLRCACVVTFPSQNFLTVLLESAFHDAVVAAIGQGVSADVVRNALMEFGFDISSPALTLCIPPSRGLCDRSPQTQQPVQAATVLEPVVVAATDALATGVSPRASDIDLAAVKTLGWPPYRGGPLFWAEHRCVQPAAPTQSTA